MGHRVPRILVGLLMVCVLFPGESLISEETKGLVRSGGADLKARPAIDSDTIVGIRGGESVLLVVRLKDTDTVLAVSGHWYFVRYRGIDGWVFDALLDTASPRAEKLYRDVPSLTERMDRLHDAKESGVLEETLNLATEIVGVIEENFTKSEIKSSKRLSEMILVSVADKIGALVYLHRFDEARAEYDYLVATYPDVKLEDELVGARELIGPYMVFANRYKSAPLFDNPEEPRDRLMLALKKRDITRVSDLAVPGVLEIWVAYTDWMMKLGEKSLIDESWLSAPWETGWSIRDVVEETDDAGEVIGWCIVTEPWEIDYYGFPVHRVDFCIDRLPDGAFALSYLILYTTPNR